MSARSAKFRRRRHLRRIDEHPSPRRMHTLGDRRSGWRTRLAVRPLHADQRRPRRQHRLQRRKIDQPVAGPPAPRPHRRQRATPHHAPPRSSIAAARSSAPGRCRATRSPRWSGSSPPPAMGRRDRAPRLFQRRTRRAPFAMRRRRIGPQIEPLRHSRPRRRSSASSRHDPVETVGQIRSIAKTGCAANSAQHSAHTRAPLICGETHARSHLSRPEGRLEGRFRPSLPVPAHRSR